MKKNEFFIYKGSGFIVADKPPFIRTEDFSRGFLPVHRLDKDTSGVLVLARDLPTQAALQKQWKERKVKKTYIALVAGLLSPKQGAIEGAIFRSLKDRKKMTVSNSLKARSAYTEYKVERYYELSGSDFSDQKGGGSGAVISLVRFFPETGRTHQIRVHAAAIGYPVIGDFMYGNKKLNAFFEERFGLTRQFLHALRLEFVHPVTKKKIAVEAPLPKDLEDVLKKIPKK